MKLFSRRWRWMSALGMVVGLALYLWQVALRHRQVEGELARAKSELTTLDSALRLARELAQEVRQRRATTMKPEHASSLTPKEQQQLDLLAMIDRVVPGPKPAPRLPQPVGRHGNVYFTELMDTPGYSEKVRAIFHISVEQRYGPWLQSITSPELRTKAAMLLVDERFIEHDADPAAGRAGLDPEQDRSQAMQLRRQLQAASRADLQRLLGEEEYSRFAAYNVTVPARESLAHIALRLSYSAEPLTPEQIARITAMMPPPSLGPPPTIDAALAAARPAFSPRQWEDVQEFARDGGKLRH